MKKIVKILKFEKKIKNAIPSCVLFFFLKKMTSYSAIP